ncbi:MAG: PQQ-binding-like beta-propeller repeat protein [Planctomycetota bacterium]
MTLENHTRSKLAAAIKLTLIFSLISVPASLPAEDWTMGRANEKGTGATSEELPKELELLWDFEIEGLGFEAGPTIADGKVFANDYDGRLVVLDLATGEEIWRKTYELGFVSTPSYKDGMLYCADEGGVLRAIEVESGEEKWKYDSQGEVAGSPVFYEESVVFTSQSGSLYRLDLKSGKEVWKYTTDEPILCGASLASNLTFLGGCDEQLHLVDLKTGKRIGEPLNIGATQSTPCATENSVLIPSHGGEIYRFELAEDGQGLVNKWTFRDRKLASEFRNSIAIHDGIAIASCGSKRIFALDMETGEVKWDNVIRRAISASPIIAGQSAIAAGTDGNIYRYDLKTGEELWQFQVKGSFLGSPAVADGKLVLGNDRGTIFCFGEKK